MNFVKVVKAPGKYHDYAITYVTQRPCLREQKPEGSIDDYQTMLLKETALRHLYKAIGAILPAQNVLPKEPNANKNTKK